MKKIVIMIISMLCILCTKAESYGWMEVAGNRVDFKFAHIVTAESDKDHLLVVYSDVNLSRTIDNNGLKQTGICSILSLMYERGSSEQAIDISELMFGLNVPVGTLGAEDISVKDYPMNCLIGEIDDDDITSVLSNSKLSASANAVPGVIETKGRTDGLKLPCKVSFSVNGLPDNWKVIMK